MQECITPHDLFSEILLMRDVDPRAVLLVEGPSDLGALDPHVNEADATCIPAHGKSNVLATLEIVEKSGLVDKVLGIVDKDWDDVAENAHTSGNVVFTDFYDLDATIIFTSRALAQVSANFCDPRKVSAHLETINKNEPVDIIVQLSLPVGILREISRENNLNLNLRDFPLVATIDWKSCSIDLTKLVSIAIARTDGFSGDKTELIRQLEGRLEGVENREYYCSGHDLLSSFSAIAAKKWGGDGGAKRLGKSIRAAFSCDSLSRTLMYNDVSRWGEGNAAKIWFCPCDSSR